MVQYLFVLLLAVSLAALPAMASATNDDLHNNPDNGERACVTLLKYKDYTCKGDPIDVRNNTVWTQPGSPCHYTSRMNGNSVTNQYCDHWNDLDSGPQFHQKVYVKSKGCNSVIHKHLTYKRNTCTYGYSIAGCTKGACENPSPPVILRGGAEDDRGMGYLRNVPIAGEEIILQN